MPAGLGNARPAASEGSKGLRPQSSRRACEIYRERKVRCDRAVPKCSRCARLGQVCGYGRRSPRDDVPTQLLKLHDRLSKAEALLSIPRNLVDEAVSPMVLDLGIPESVAPKRRQLQQAPALPQPLNHTDVPANENTLDDYDLFTDLSGITDVSSNLALDWTPLPGPTLKPMESPLEQADPPRASQFHVLPPINHHEQVSTEDLTGLHKNYFDVVYHSFPFLSRERFYAEIINDIDSPAALGLKYAVAMIGCTISSKYLHWQSACYHIARNYVEQCERDGEERNIASLNLFQALLFIIRFETMDQKLNRAWITLGRAVQISRMLGLSQMDRVTTESKSNLGLRMNLPPTQDQLLLEERRRSFWGLYILESFVRTRTGMKCELGSPETFEVFLPSPGLLVSTFKPAKMPFPRNLMATSCPEISSYAGCVLMVELALRCFDHGQETDTNAKKRGFWDNHYVLVKTIDERFAMLQAHLNAQAVREDPVAFSVYMNLRATEIFFYETAISQKRSMAAAFKIASAVRLNWPVAQSERDIFMLQATFIAWPLVMAMKTMSRDLHKAESVSGGGVTPSLRLLLGALDHIEEPCGYWHGSIASVLATLLELDEKGALESVTL
ncbi:hypothetical protein F4779DRAFT_643345 [Xylariaceae sp. FL0662B]|nr:hypothetical protein F4779DRAFT_643345 [Xylariaceae sp. FL0662B]